MGRDASGAGEVDVFQQVQAVRAAVWALTELMGGPEVYPVRWMHLNLMGR